MIIRGKEEDKGEKNSEGTCDQSSNPAKSKTFAIRDQAKYHNRQSHNEFQGLKKQQKRVRRGRWAAAIHFGRKLSVGGECMCVLVYV